AFSPGDQISVESQEEQTGAMIAVNVYWEKGASAQTTRNGDEKGGAVDTWKDEPKDSASKDSAAAGKNSAAPARESAAAPKDSAPPAIERVSPSRRDPDDPGPPTLKRGKPTDASREHASEPPAQ